MSELNRKKNRKGSGKNKDNSSKKENTAMNEANLMPTQPTLLAPPIATLATEVVDPASAPSSPTRAFCAFNDSVDNVNLEDLRDMLPEDHIWRDVYPDATQADGHHRSNLEAIVEDDGCAAQAAVGAEEDAEQSKQEDCDVEPQQVDLRELELLELDQERTGGATGGEERSNVAPEDKQSGIDESRYLYGPAIPSKKSKGLHVYGAGGERSYAEVAEAVVLAVATLMRDWTSTRHPQQRYGDEADGAEERSVSVHIPGRRVRGALGYVVHTALSLVYSVAVKYPLQLAAGAASLVLSALAAIASAVLQLAWWVLSAYLWALLLPLRLLERTVTLLWQSVLGRAVHFLNQQPSHAHSSFSGTGGAPHKHTIPTAINGHAHKH